MVSVLALFGVLAVYSASFAFGALEFGDSRYFVVRQAAFAVVGLAILLVVMRFDYRHLRALSILLLLAALGLLLATLIPGVGVEANGAQRWIALGPLPPLQPSEFAKLALIIYIAHWLSAKGAEVQSLSTGVLPFVFVVGPIAALVMAQPDMGTMLILLMVTGTQFFLGGASLRHVTALAAAGTLAAVLLMLTGGYRTDRLMAFISPESDADGTGFHTLQLLIALGSGGITGVDWGESRQKFFYIPGAHTDGVFAIIGEELGFVGALAVIVLIALLVYRALRIASRSRDEFGFLLAAGVAAWISYQAILNLGGITRSVPMTGLPMPFLSYGGSALIALMAATGLLLSVSRFGRDGEELSAGRLVERRRGGKARPAGRATAGRPRAAGAARRKKRGTPW